MEIKICTKCGKELPATIEYFHRKESGKFNLNSWCVECCREYNKQRYEERKDYVLKKRKKFRDSEKGKIYQEEYYGSKNYKTTRKKYQQSKKGIKTTRKTRKKWRKKNKLSCNMSSSMSRALKGNKAGKHWETLVPYTLEDLKQHLENLFQLKMSWNNYGKWHVDHKIPRSNFKFTSHEDKEFQKCWALENLQPLWAEENQRKSNKLVW